jgi:hypothetical protein
MAKISSPILFSQQFNIDTQVLDEKGIFDPILNIDTKLFIDPTLLQRSEHELIKNQATKEFRQFCENILSLLEESKVKDDYAYRAAGKLIQVKEIEGTCLGYGTNSISGRSLSRQNKEKIIYTASEIVRIGIKKPELFILLPLFEEGIGADTISDITTSAIQNTLFDFTLNIAKELNIKTTQCIYNGKTLEIIKNPLQKKISPVLLLPQDILRQLPFASTWDDIIDTTNFNSSLRAKVNRYISQTWKAKTKKEKERQLASLMKNKEGINTLIEVVNESKVKPYDFEIDEESVMFPQRIAEIVSKNPLEISSKNNTNNELKKIVKTIIGQFQFLIENKGINMLLWKGKSEPNKEKTTQKIFLLVAYSYCKANDIDISPEMDSGRGYVDFKFSKGFSKKIIVEIKHSYNPKIIDGFSEQLQLYKKTEETVHGYYIIVDVGGIGKKYEKLTEMYNNDPQKRAEIIYVDGHLKPSASKIKSKNKKADAEFLDIDFEISDSEIPEIELSETEIIDSCLQEYIIDLDNTLKESENE